MRALTKFALLFFISCSSTPQNRSLSSLPAEQVNLAMIAVSTTVHQYATADMNGSRINFDKSNHWSDYVHELPEEGENDVDSIDIVKGYQIRGVTISPDLKTARALVAYEQFGTLNNDGTFKDSWVSVQVPIDLINVDNKWKVRKLPASLPQVSKATALAHYTNLKARSKNKGSLKFYNAAIAALEKLPK